MSLPDQAKAAASSGSWFDSILEGAGELVGGAVDVVGDFGNDWLGIKMGNELERAKSASPDENRANNNNYQQPNGQPVNTSVKVFNGRPLPLWWCCCWLCSADWRLRSKGASDANHLSRCGGLNSWVSDRQGNQQISVAHCGDA